MAASEWGFGYPSQIEIEWNGDLYKPSTFSDMLFAEYVLRESVQREEMLQRMIRSLEKAAAIEPEGKSQLTEANSELDQVRAQCYRNQQALYRAEAVFPLSVKRDYYTLRTDEDWYMREEMVQDCAEKGGCCSRGCGCCARRKLSERCKGLGHCTSECWCCSEQRGFEISCEEKQEIQQKYKEMLEGETQAFLRHSTNCFVSPLKHQVPSKSLYSRFMSRWRLIFM
ncbi:hypothetical protein N7528_010221 [Penicillium herquei]|nr:hypothetical protein N7528_010221 [Penicillium herquei]